jgi:hypothetical protein
MKNLTKAAVLSAAVALAGQGAYAATGDLILGFTGNSAATDTTFNLGSLSSSTISTGNLSSGLNSFASSGVMGYFGSGSTAGNGIDISVTRAGSTAIGLQGTESAPPAPPTATTLGGAIADVSAIQIGSGVASFTGNSYSANTVAANPGVQNDSVFSDNGGNSSLVANGTVMDIFSETIGTGSGRGSVPTTVAYVGQLDLFNLGGAANYEFIPAGFVAAVPEPSTYGIIAASGLLALALRRKFSPKNA